jgi:hypothetical protein
MGISKSEWLRLRTDGFLEPAGCVWDDNQRGTWTTIDGDIRLLEAHLCCIGGGVGAVDGPTYAPLCINHRADDQWDNPDDYPTSHRQKRQGYAKAFQAESGRIALLFADYKGRPLGYRYEELWRVFIAFPANAGNERGWNTWNFQIIDNRPGMDHLHPITQVEAERNPYLYDNLYWQVVW